ncbi:MAG: hypothetical protein LBN71_10535, partial [Tannerella sp.]|nr:hypothetical protein [Tannerella sp.]
MKYLLMYNSSTFGKVFLMGFFCSFIAMGINAQKVVKLWDGNPPVSNGITAAENTDANFWIT